MGASSGGSCSQSCSTMGTMRPSALFAVRNPSSCSRASIDASSRVHQMLWKYAFVHKGTSTRELPSAWPIVTGHVEPPSVSWSSRKTAGARPSSCST
jgi:hypothetical protein